MILPETMLRDLSFNAESDVIPVIDSLTVTVIIRLGRDSLAFGLKSGHKNQQKVDRLPTSRNPYDSQV